MLNHNFRDRIVVNLIILDRQACNRRLNHGTKYTDNFTRECIHERKMD